MAETTLKTRVKLLYKTYEEWEAIKTTFIPLKGELCITGITQASGQTICMIKIGQWDGVDGSASKKSYSELPYLFANSSDVFEWAKRESLNFNDLDATFLAALDARIAEKSENVEYQMIGENGVWKLQKREIGSETWTDVSTVDVASYVTPLITTEKERAEAAEATKVTAEVVGTNGTSQILQEGDGGGSHFIHNDGSESYVGVNDGGKDGMMAQIYADVQEDGAWVGSRINVYHNGIYYVSKANQKAGYAKNAAEMEIATKKDIQDLGQALHFVGIATQNEGETEAQAVERTFPAANQTAGAVAICGNKEFICAGTPLAWKEFGDVSAYATKAELEAETAARSAEDGVLQANIDAEASTRQTADETLQANIDAEEARAKAAEATKTTQEITSDTGKALVWNESSGGGAKYEHTDGTVAFAGVNNGGKNGNNVVLYSYDSATGEGARLKGRNSGFYYFKGKNKTPEAADEIAVQGDLTNAATTTLDSAKAYTDEKVGELDSSLAAIAKTGNVNDLQQTSGDVLILDCNL